MILIIDGMNFCHRARSGFSAGEFAVVYNVFRQLRAQVELHAPTRVIMALEGRPKKRLALFPDYKANRAIDTTTEEGARKHAAKQDFLRQADVVLALMRQHFPVSLVRHPDYEADDLIHTLVMNSATSSEFTVVSSDSDFTQMLQAFPNVRLYDPIAKAYVSAPEGYDYLYWKALRGDPSDNVPALPGVTDGIARELLDDPDALRSFFSRDDNARLFERNCSLIRLHHITGDDSMEVTCSTPVRDWDAVKRQFDDWAFKSITKSGTWEKFVQTFDPLFG